MPLHRYIPGCRECKVDLNTIVFDFGLFRSILLQQPSGSFLETFLGGCEGPYYAKKWAWLSVFCYASTSNTSFPVPSIKSERNLLGR